jgi:hypothetical protein
MSITFRFPTANRIEKRDVGPIKINLAQVCPGDLSVQLDGGPPRVLRTRRGEQHKYSVHAPMKVGLARTAGTHHLLLTVRDLTPAAPPPYCRVRLAARLDILLRDLPDQSTLHAAGSG